MQALFLPFAKLFGVFKTAMYVGVKQCLHAIIALVPCSGGCFAPFLCFFCVELGMRRPSTWVLFFCSVESGMHRAHERSGSEFNCAPSLSERQDKTAKPMSEACSSPSTYVYTLCQYFWGNLLRPPGVDFASHSTASMRCILYCLVVGVWCVQ